MQNTVRIGGFLQVVQKRWYMQKQTKTSDMSDEEKEERLRYLDYMNKTIYKDIEIPQGVEDIRREKYYGE